jgi:uncharacterized protein (TIGR02466 family)
LFDRPAFQKLRGLIMAESEAFAASYGLDTARFPMRLNECWVNVYGQGDAQDIHIHRNSVLSGIYYVAAPPQSGDLLFHSPTGDIMLEPPIVGSNLFNASIRNITPSAGTMILFRSWLRHSVKPTLGKEERISVAFNFTM